MCCAEHACGVCSNPQPPFHSPNPHPSPSPSPSPTHHTPHPLPPSQDDLCKGDDVFFAATGVSDGDLLRGVRYHSGGASTNSIVMRCKSGTGGWRGVRGVWAGGWRGPCDAG